MGGGGGGEGGIAWIRTGTDVTVTPATPAFDRVLVRALALLATVVSAETALLPSVSSATGNEISILTDAAVTRIVAPSGVSSKPAAFAIASRIWVFFVSS